MIATLHVCWCSPSLPPSPNIYVYVTCMADELIRVMGGPIRTVATAVWCIVVQFSMGEGMQVSCAELDSWNHPAWSQLA